MLFAGLVITQGFFLEGRLQQRDVDRCAFIPGLPPASHNEAGGHFEAVQGSAGVAVGRADQEIQGGRGDGPLLAPQPPV